MFLVKQKGVPVSAQAETVRIKRAGFTLLELMFAAGVLATALAILFGSLVTMYTLGEVNEGRTKASNHLSSCWNRSDPCR